MAETQPDGLPYREIWLEPFCDQCWTGRLDITWCQDRVYDDCVECGRKPIRYALDTRQRKGEAA
jgi:hypothetical protein